MGSQLRVIVIGTGKVGCDLLVKIIRSEKLKCVCFIGRNKHSEGLLYANSIGVATSFCGRDGLAKYANDCDLVIDASSALSHVKHAELLAQLKKPVINLTPANLGVMCIPCINGDDIISHKNISMVTCGGQSSVPIAYTLAKRCKSLDYIEVVSSISSASAGHATRSNIDEYIQTTQEALMFFSGCKNTKAILNINPAVPGVSMKTTLFAKVSCPNMVEILSDVREIVRQVQLYVPGYALLVEPCFDGEKITLIVGVVGCGDYLPRFAGNLDIITSAAINVAEKIADSQRLDCHKLAV